MGDFTLDIFTGEVVSEKGSGRFKYYLFPITFEDFDLNGYLQSSMVSVRMRSMYTDFNSGKAIKRHFPDTREVKMLNAP